MANGARELTAPHYSTLPWDRELRIVPGVLVARGRFEVREELARGGMAVVYRARDLGRRGAEVALKVGTAKADRPETEARFHNEHRLGSSLAGHPHVVSPLSMGRLDGPEGFEGRMYLVTELIDGTALDLVIAGHPNGLPVPRACAIARDVARALADLHRGGIVHRDIKPSNVLLTKGDPERARVIDFGLAYATGDGWEDKSPDLTEDGRAPGTLLYMSPQQATHERPTPAFDIYSLGVMMYELFAGEPPYHGLGFGELLLHKCDPSREPYPLSRLCPELLPELAEFVHRCMRHDPEARPSADDVVERLGEVLGGMDPRVPVVVSAQTSEVVIARSRRGRWGRRRNAAIMAAALGVTTAVTGMVWPYADESSASEASLVAEEPSTLTMATHAKVEGHAEPEVRPEPPVVAAPAPVSPRAEVLSPSPRDEPAPDSRGRRRRPVQHARLGPDPVVEPETDPCPGDVRAAREAARLGQWKRVLQLTKNVRCWPADAVDERIKLRTWALYETERFAECANEGKSSTDRNVARWTSICEQRVRDGGTAT